MAFRNIAVQAAAVSALIVLAETPSSAENGSLDPYERGRQQAREGMERALEEARPEMLRMMDERRGYRRDVTKLMRQALSSERMQATEGAPSDRNLLAAGMVYQFMIEQADFTYAGAAARLVQDIYRNAMERFASIASLKTGPVQRDAIPLIASYLGIEGVREANIVENSGQSLKIQVEMSGGTELLEINHPQLVVAQAMGFSLEQAETQLVRAASQE